MASDLTERLAAKLSSVREPWGFAWESESPEGQTYAELVADYAPTLLPLLLSEPELVAGLAESVRGDLLRTLADEQACIAECPPSNDYAAEVWRRAIDLIPPTGTPFVREVRDRLSVLTPSETLVEALEKAGVGTYSAEYRGMVARDAEAILKVSARFASPEAKREVLAALIGEPDLFWSQSNNEVGLPSVSEAADFCEMDAGDVQEFDVAKTLGKRWVAMLPTDAERDDGWEGGIGWLDGEATLFGSLEEAEKAMVERKAALSALHQELTEGGE